MKSHSTLLLNGKAGSRLQKLPWNIFLPSIRSKLGENTSQILGAGVDRHDVNAQLVVNISMKEVIRLISPQHSAHTHARTFYKLNLTHGNHVWACSIVVHVDSLPRFSPRSCSQECEGRENDGPPRKSFVFSVIYLHRIAMREA